MTINQQSLRCVGERKKVFLPDITGVQRLNSQAGGQAKESLNQDVSFRGSIILKPDQSRPSHAICSNNLLSENDKLFPEDWDFVVAFK